MTHITYEPHVVSKQRVRINLLLVYMLIFVSGSWRYSLHQDAYLVLAFVISLVSWFTLTDRKLRDSFVLYVVVFSGILLSLSLYTGGSLSLTSVISATLKLTMAYFIVRTVGKSFIDNFITVISILAAFSLFGYFVDTFHLADGIVRLLPRSGEMGREGFLYLYDFSWHIDRNNSIFYEPGAYQIFLNAAMFMLLFVKTDFSSQTKWRLLALLVTALVTTFSTTAFLMFSVMFVLFLVRSEILNASGKFKVILMATVVISVFSVQFYATLVEKVSDYLSANEYDFGYSAQTRSSHAKTDLKLFRRHVFGLGHNEYKKEFIIAGRADEEQQSSNGVTKMLAMYGLPFSIFIFGSYYWAFKRLLEDNLLSVTAFLLLMLFIASQSFFMFSPVCFAVIASAFVISPRLSQDQFHNENGINF